MNFKIRYVGAVPTGGCGADHPYDGEGFGGEEIGTGRKLTVGEVTIDYRCSPHQAERYTPRIFLFLEGQSHRFQADVGVGGGGGGGGGGLG